MNVVLDTNALLVSIARKSRYRIIFDSLLANKFDMIISNDILSEYTEVLAQKTNAIVANSIGEMLLSLPNVHRQDIFYKWWLIEVDRDDNKFVDCMIAGNADYLVSNDRHFNCLREIDFPKLSLLSIDEFVSLLSTMQVPK